MTNADANNCPLSVLIVDSDERVRESLAGLLQIGRRCVVVASAAEPARALELISQHRPDVVVLDPRLPEIDGGRILVAAIREQWPSIRVVVLGLAATLEQPGVLAAADAYVRKTLRPQELLDAIAVATRPRPTSQVAGEPT